MRHGRLRWLGHLERIVVNDLGVCLDNKCDGGRGEMCGAGVSCGQG